MGDKNEKGEEERKGKERKERENKMGFVNQSCFGMIERERERDCTDSREGKSGIPHSRPFAFTEDAIDFLCFFLFFNQL